MNSLPRLGYVGLGAMGLPFALHLHRAGYQVTGFNRSDRPYAEARAGGLAVAESLQACVDASDILFMCLPSSAAIEETLARIDKPGLVCCDNSSVSQSLALKLNANLKARQMAYVECPIFGSAQNAIDAEVFLIASGDAESVATILPIASCASREAIAVGGPGAASLMKILQNGLGHVQLTAIAETLVTAERAGLEPEQFVKVVSACGGMASTPLFRRKAPQMLNIPEKTGAKLAIASKDAHAAADMARDVGLDHAMIVKAAERYARAEDMNLGNQDFSAVIKAVG